MTQWLSLTALDTLFFRGPERFDAEAGGGAYLSSLFPPHPGTVFAALNAALLNGAGLPADPAFEHEDGPRAQPGHHASRGPWLLHATHGLLLPAPRALVIDAPARPHLLRPSAQPWQTDLGPAVHMLEAPAATDKISVLDDAWLPLAAYQAWLNGRVPSQWLKADALWSTERHTGLARSPTDRTAIDGRLYSAAHIRPNLDLSLLVNLPGTAAGARWPAAAHLPLGGEGRAVWVDVVPQPPALPQAPTLAPARDGKLRYTLSLITPGLGAAWGVSPGHPVHKDVPGHIVCCALGQPLRIGGFDTRLRMPERVRSARAAGSVWWLEAEAADLGAVRQLHGTCIGAANAQGYGHVMVGAWPQ